jgi:hypothetical protein
VLLVAASNRIADRQPLIPELRRMLEGVQPGTLVRVGA